jgi:hypothetical protein
VLCKRFNSPLSTKEAFASEVLEPATDAAHGAAVILPKYHVFPSA